MGVTRKDRKPVPATDGTASFLELAAVVAEPEILPPHVPLPTAAEEGEGEKPLLEVAATAEPPARVIRIELKAPKKPRKKSARNDTGMFNFTD